eukprot:5427731-Pleurochrysis_carterae.AAC.7
MPGKQLLPDTDTSGCSRGVELLRRHLGALTLVGAVLIVHCACGGIAANCAPRLAFFISSSLADISLRCCRVGRSFSSLVLAFYARALRTPARDLWFLLPFVVVVAIYGCYCFAPRQRRSTRVLERSCCLRSPCLEAGCRGTLSHRAYARAVPR